jgi:hypothetical protein
MHRRVPPLDWLERQLNNSTMPFEKRKFSFLERRGIRDSVVLGLNYSTVRARGPAK